ncbi:MAG TPA: hypothetical protein VGD67_23485, partial [Pseudonocardiaceae bacterium]
MSNILIVHRFPMEPFPYLDWFAGHDGDIVLLADRERMERFGERVPTTDLGYTHLEVLDRFEDDLVIRRGLELAAKFDVEHIVALHEADVVNGAVLRERLGLPGPLPADVLPYRDKALMKQLAARAGIEIAPHTLPRTADDARAFAAAHGHPLVFKDRAGLNSIGVRVLRDPAEFEPHLGRTYAGGPREDVLLEAFVPGRMSHVDGLVAGGRTVLAWPSQYQYDLSAYASDHGPRIDLTMEPDDPLTDRMLTLTDRVLAALRTPGGRLRDFAFHAEIFHTPDDRLVLCEIACRPGGAKIREMFTAMFGIDPGEYSARAQLGLPLPGLEDAVAGGGLPRPRVMSGQLLMMKRQGLARRLPEPPPDPWVERFWMYARPGGIVPPAAGSSDVLTAVVASAPDRAECERRLRELA